MMGKRIHHKLPPLLSKNHTVYVREWRKLTGKNSKWIRKARK